MEGKQKMTKVYYDQDVSLEPLMRKTVAIIGYGSQGQAQAQNMKDSGIHVILGLRPNGASLKMAEKDGFEVYPISKATQKADIVHMLVPDLEQSDVYKNQIAPNMTEGKVLCFSHGFNIHFKQIIPPSNVDVIMVAPKSPGRRVRETYLDGFGVPALVAVYQNPSRKAMQVALAMAKSIGCTRAGVLETTFKEETESDLIGEQTVLVGGLVDAHVKENMRKAAKLVQSGEFAKEWIKKSTKAKETLDALMKPIEEHQIET